MDDSLIACMIETAAFAKEKAEERLSTEMLEALERLGSLLCVQASSLRGFGFFLISVLARRGWMPRPARSKI